MTRSVLSVSFLAPLLLSLCLTTPPAQARVARRHHAKLPRREKTTEAVSAARALAHPLIIGASVSSGFITTSPGDRAALRYTSASNIVNQARAGASGSEFANITAASLSAYTSVIAVDFLFWDSTSRDTGASVSSLRNLVASAREARIPLIIGDVPQLRGEQVSTDELNRAIYGACVKSAGCSILPLVRLHEKAMTTGIEINGSLYNFNDLTADGMHLNATGSEYVAGLIIGSLNSTSRRSPRPSARARSSK